MTYLVLSGGLAGLGVALYGRARDIRFLGGLAAGVVLLYALFDWGSW
ncbi:hypothetical protein [Streptomyces sp. NPDC055055]